MIGVGVDLINGCQISRGTLDKHTESIQILICYNEQTIVPIRATWTWLAIGFQA